MQFFNVDEEEIEKTPEHIEGMPMQQKKADMSILC